MSNDNEDFGLSEAGLPDTWTSSAAAEALVHERSVRPDETHEAMGRRLLAENVGVAVMGIIHTAEHGSNERLRLDAQKYIVERVLGKVGDDAFEVDPLAKFISEVTEYVNVSDTPK